jgi:hypothetical protein
MLTATLYVDFGDRFPGGSISGVTVGDFEAQTLGPSMYGNSDFPFNASDSLRLESMKSVYGVATGSVRADAMSLLRRYYEPFDITVVELTADFQRVNGHNVRAAATLTEAASTLAVNNADQKHNDSYVFVSRFVVNGVNILDKAFSLMGGTVSLGGVANGKDVGTFNSHDGTAAVFLQDTPNSKGVSVAATVAHEAGHLFGLNHVYRTTFDDGYRIDIPSAASDAAVLYGSELMSYSQIANDSTFANFMRYPTILGDDNKSYNALSAAAFARSPAEQFLLDPNIGPSSVEYVTGTGASDIIFVERDSPTQATVRVRAFTKEWHKGTIPDPANVAIPVPGGAGVEFAYTIDLTRPLIIDAGLGDDLVVLDGDLGTQVTVRGMGGNDTLEIKGKHTASATYAPGAEYVGLDGTTSRRGTVTVGATAIRFDEFEYQPVYVDDVNKVTFVTPQWSAGDGGDHLFVGQPEFRSPFGPSPQLTVGSYYFGQRIAPLVVGGASSIVIDVASNDIGASIVDDEVDVSEYRLEGLASVQVLGGIGDDVFKVRSWFGGQNVTALTLDGGDGDDQFVIGDGDINRVRAPVAVDAGAGADRITVSDGDYDYRVDYLVTPTSVTSTTSFGGLTYSGSTEFLDVLGTDGANVFDVQPSLATRYLIDGNLPGPDSLLAAEGDFLRLDTKTGFPVSPNGLDTSGRRLSMTARGVGTWSFSAATGRKSVDFRSIERFNHVERIAVASDAGSTSQAIVRMLDAETGALLFEIPASVTYGAGYRDGVRVATGDLDNDGIPDVVTAPGRSTAPIIKVFSGAPIPGVEGALIAGTRLPASSTYGAAFLGGVNVAVGDVVGDGRNDIILAPSRGRAIIKVFEGTSTGIVKTAARTFDAFPGQAGYIGGATVAAGDIAGVGKQQVVVGSGVGIRGQTKVFDVRMPATSYASLVRITDPTVPDNRGGVQVAVGDVDGDGRADIVTGVGAGSGAWVRAYSGRTSVQLFAIQTGTKLGATIPTRVAVRSIDGESRMAVFATWGADARQNYRIRRIDPVSKMAIDDLSLPMTGISGGGLNVG